VTRDFAPRAVALAIAVSVAVAQTARGLLGGSSEYGATVALAWFAAIWLLSEAEPLGRYTASRAAHAAGMVGLVLAASISAASARYHAGERLTPLLAGLSLAIAAAGIDGLRRYRRELSLLALPLLHPLPTAVRESIEPVLIISTASVATWFSSALGLEAVRQGNLLVMETTTLEVVSACAGVLGISRLLLLAILVIALFQMSRAQKVALLASAIVIAFVVNAVRVAVLALVLVHDEPRFDYWDSGRGSTVFALLSPLLAGLAWWLMLRSRRHGRRPYGPAA